MTQLLAASRRAIGSSRGGRITVLLLAAQGVAAVTALLTNVLSARVMGPSGRGDLAFWLQIAYLAGTLAMLGTEKPYAASRRTHFHNATRDQLILLRVALSSIGLVATACLVVYTVRPEPWAGVVSGIAFMTLFTAASRIVRTSYISSSASIVFVSSTFATQILLGVGSYLAFRADVRDPLAWLALYGLASVPSLAIVICSALRPYSGERTSRRSLREVRGIGLRLIPASLGNTAMLRSDRLLLPILSSSRELGLYVVVATTMELASWPVSNYIDATIFQWRAKIASGQFSVKHVVLRTAAAGTGLSVLFALASWMLVRQFLGPSFDRSAGFIWPLAVAAVVYSMSRTLQGVLIASARGGSASISETVGMVVSVVCYVVLIPVLGGFGAAVGSAVGYASCCVVAAVLVLHNGRNASSVPGRTDRSEGQPE